MVILRVTLGLENASPSIYLTGMSFRRWLFLFPFLFLATPVFSKSMLRVHIESKPESLDPVNTTGIREMQIIHSLFEGLTRHDPATLKPIPGAAFKWHISADRKTYTFIIRSDAKWNDGRSVTAQDFWYAWERLLNPKNAAGYAYQLYYLKNAEAYAEGKITDPHEIGMKVKGTRIFEVTLEKPVPYFLSLTAFGALSPIRKDAAQPELKTNGPFYLKEFDKEGKVTLLPNEHYWGRRDVRLSGVQFVPFANFFTALKFYGATGIDIMTDLPPTQVPLLKFRSDFRSEPLLNTGYFLINCAIPPFDKKEVRKALALALNRRDLLNQIKKEDLPFGFFVPPGIPNYKNPPTPQTFQVVEAQKLLKNAGYDKSNPFPKFAVLHHSATDRRMVVEAAEKMWKENLGITIERREIEWDAYMEARRDKNYTIAWAGWYGDYLDPQTFLELFLSKNPHNQSNWSNTNFDRLLDEAGNATTQEERMRLLSQAEQILLEEAPLIPVSIKTKTYLIHPYVKGYFPNLFDIHPLRDVYLTRP